MEVAGFTIGVLSLLSTCKDCLELYSMIATAKNLATDAELLITKLDIEKLLFLQWAERVRLLKHDPDRRLRDPKTAEAVQRILLNIRGLLSEGKVLKERYGLTEATDARGALPEDQQFISSRRATQFFEEYSLRQPPARINVGASSKAAGGWREWIPRSRSKSPGPSSDRDNLPLKEIRWVIKDKENFDNLVQQLQYFNLRLDALLPPLTDSPVSSSMSAEDFDPLPIRTLRLLLEASSDRHPLIANAARGTLNRKLQQRVFRSAVVPEVL
jgi:hypothetical protein